LQDLPFKTLLLVRGGAGSVEQRSQASWFCAVALFEQCLSRLIHSGAKAERKDSFFGSLAGIT